jgi:hypothetical protein
MTNRSPQQKIIVTPGDITSSVPRSKTSRHHPLHWGLQSTLLPKTILEVGAGIAHKSAANGKFVSTRQERVIFELLKIVTRPVTNWLA